MNEDADGLTFVNVFNRGFGNRWNAYVWYLQTFNDRLYVGTFDLSEDGYGVPGFDLFSSKEAMPNSGDWIKETQDGFGHPAQVGLRSMTITDDGIKMLIGSTTDQDKDGCIVCEATKATPK